MERFDKDGTSQRIVERAEKLLIEKEEADTRLSEFLDILPTTGEALRKARKAAGITQEDMAKKVGVSQPFITKVELHRVKPSPAVRVAILKALAG